jgi:hypothetical protein
LVPDLENGDFFFWQAKPKIDTARGEQAQFLIENQLAATNVLDK